MELHGRNFSRQQLRERCGLLEQVGGIERGVLSEGAARGARFIRFSTGAGLGFEVIPDRAMDVFKCSWRGVQIGWQSPVGLRAPTLHESNDEEGLSMMRSFSGLNFTCGLDHVLAGASDDASHFNYENRPQTHHPFHGRVAYIPATMASVGRYWVGDECMLFCEGEIRQAAVFGENLTLTRRYEAALGGKSFKLIDRVRNDGFTPVTHMYLYHINLAFPLVDEGTRFVAPIRRVVWASHEGRLDYQNVGYEVCPAPQLPFHEQVFEHEMVADDSGDVRVAVVNESFNNGQGLGFTVKANQTQFPHMYQWQCFQKGYYALGIEPSTNHVRSRREIRERGEMIWLEPGEERIYETEFEVLADRAELAATEAEIRRVCTQPTDKYPAVEAGNADARGGL